MQCGMFGKLPSKRDFVSYNMPRPFLDQWESWLQSAVAASKHALGEKWQEVFLTAPIWRFWFGSQVFGQSAAGVLMPSVDGIGRYFPLSICACKPDGMFLAPPPDEGLDAWHEACEQFLLRLLEEAPGDDAATMLAALPFAPTFPEVRVLPAQRGSSLIWTSDDASLAQAFQTLHESDTIATHDSRAYWWTLGGRNFRAQLAVLNGKPDPMLLTSIMTGAFS